VPPHGRVGALKGTEKHLDLTKIGGENERGRNGEQPAALAEDLRDQQGEKGNYEWKGQEEERNLGGGEKRQQMQ